MSTAPHPPDLHAPLTPAVFAILLALADGEKHGYAIMKEAALPAGGRIYLGPGTLYGSLDRLVLSGLVAETGLTDDARRRYYRITALGSKSLAAETTRLQQAVSRARGKGVRIAEVSA